MTALRSHKMGTLVPTFSSSGNIHPLLHVKDLAYSICRKSVNVLINQVSPAELPTKLTNKGKLFRKTDIGIIDQLGILINTLKCPSRFKWSFTSPNLRIPR